MQKRCNQPYTNKENMINNVVLNLQYNELVCAEKQALDIAESHFYDYMFPTIRETIETYQSHKIEVEKIVIDLGTLELSDIPQKLEMMLKEALEKHITENEERTRLEREMYISKKNNNQYMLDFIGQEQIPWMEESELFEPESWWNKNLQELLLDPSELQTLYKLCQSEIGPLYRLLKFTNKSALIQILAKWIIDGDIIPRQLKEVLSKAGLNTEHTILLKTQQLTKVQIELLLITILSVKEYSSTSLFKNATKVLTSIIQKTFNYAKEFSENDLEKELLNLVFSSAIYNTRHSDNMSTSDTYVSTGNTGISVIKKEHSSPTKTDIPAINTAISSVRPDIYAAEKEYLSSTKTDISTTKPDVSAFRDNNFATEEECFSSTLTYGNSSFKGHDYSNKENDFANNHEGSSTHRRDENSLEHTWKIQCKTSEFPTTGDKTDEQIKMLLNSLFSDMKSYSVDTEDTKRYFTDVAGIVLLHPFLANYFRQVRLLDKNNQFISLEKQIHAVHLLRFLTGKRGRHNSHLLNVEKIICGLSPTCPIPSNYNISKTEEEEAQDMFAAIKQYWKSISKTSIEGIQTSFIHRHGTITFEKPYWLIRVEGSTLDILMDDLPWEMSMLMFPWMDKNILIEWQSTNY